MFEIERLNEKIGDYIDSRNNTITDKGAKVNQPYKSTVIKK